MAKKTPIPVPVQNLKDLIKFYEKSPKRWCQGSKVVYNDKKQIIQGCLLTGLGYVYLDLKKGEFFDLQYKQTRQFISASLPESSTSIIDFNDKKGRKVEQVINVLKKALAKAIAHYEKLDHQKPSQSDQP